MNNYIACINQELEKLENISIDKTDINFLNKFNLNVNSLIEYDDIDLLTALCMVNNGNTYINTKKVIDECIDFYEDIFLNDPHDIIDMCESFYQTNLRLNNPIIKLEDFMKLKIKDENYKYTKKILKAYKKVYDNDYMQKVLTSLLNENNLDAIALIANLKEYKKDIKKYQINSLMGYNIFDEKDINNKIKKRIVKKINKDIVNNKSKELYEIIKNRLNTFSKYRDKLNKNINTKTKERNYKIRDYNLLKNDILSGKLSIEKLKKYKLDDKIYNIGLKALIKLNNKDYEKTYKLLNEYRKKDLSKIELLFHEYDLNLNILNLKQKELLSNVDIKTIEENLKFIKTSSFSFLKENDNAFIKILLLNKQLLEELNNLLVRNRITKDFILKNENILDSTNVIRLINNIYYLESLKINFEKINTFDDSLLYNLNIKLLELLKRYNINFEKLVDFSILKNIKLINYLDMFFEMGLNNIIINNPNIINNNSLDIIKRINIMKYLNEDITNEHGTLKLIVTKGIDFYLGDNYLNMFTYFNYSHFMNKEYLDILNNNENIDLLCVIPDEILFIEDYKYRNDLYKIGDKLYSRNKVLRLLNTLINNGYTDYKDMLFNVLIYNYPSNISLEDINSLKSIIYRKGIKKLV